MQDLEPGQEYGGKPGGNEELDRLRQAVDDIYEKAGLDIYGPSEELPATDRTPLTREGEPVDEAKRQRIIKAQQAVDYAIETMPKPEPSDIEQLLLG